MTRRYRIAIHGPVFWGSLLAGQLSEQGLPAISYSSGYGRWAQWRFLGWVLARARRAQALHMLTASFGLRLPRLAKGLGLRLVYHWIGTDAYSLGRLPAAERARAVARLNDSVDAHLADSPEIREELQGLGLKVAEVVRLLPETVRAEVLDLPARSAVLCYWNDAHAAFHRADWILETARRWPHVPFLVAAATGVGLDAPGNVRFLGWQSDLTPFYREVSVLLRLPEHDSISAMVLEALARGRHVVCTRQIPHCRHVDSAEEACQALGELFEVRDPNHAGAQWVRENFDPRRELRKLARVYHQLGVNG